MCVSGQPEACKRRENPEGDSFVVNAFLRRGMEECERYSSATEHKLKNAQVSRGSSNQRAEELCF
ncbi:unnamed protein product [Tetraodon nigroviridis]|uniref:(spotted green pufferfish) hypothetical protein n=1 Tax=Tetraodon nigroviridis TaxID=99883 RepID=Q4RI06_TETNG|nr:unnamed protein product [Tetraodon nigroviridis]